MKEFGHFSPNADRAAPFTGGHALVCIERRLSALKERGPSVPKKSRYCLKVPGEALGAEFPRNRPEICAATRAPRAKPTKHATAALFGIIRKFETVSCDGSVFFGGVILFPIAPTNFRIAPLCGNGWSCEHLRFEYSDSRNFRKRKGPVFGVNELGDAANRDLIGELVRPIIFPWGGIKPAEEGGIKPLYTWVSNTWGINDVRKFTHGGGTSASYPVRTRRGV